MTKLLNSHPLAEDLGKLFLRVLAGGLMLLDHGWPKLAGFGEKMDTFPDPIGLGPALSLGLITFAEVLCALLVVLGIWTRLSTIPLIIGMAVITFITHGDDILGQGESGLLYLTAFLAILLLGAGRFSLDRLSLK
ncbi:MAG TPA: DoxX family protein [Flavobacteriales bacterium]|nr:DoxX family protein [Flavobacteriales bacterium]